MADDTTDPTIQPFLQWAEETLSARVVSCRRQGERRSGGRPAYFIDFERGSERVRTYARMDRGDGQLIGNWDAFTTEWTPRRLTTTVLGGQPLVAILGDNDLSTSIEYRNVATGKRWRTFMLNDLNRAYDLAFVADADGNGRANDPGIAVVGEKLDRLGRVVSNRLTVLRFGDGEKARNTFFSNDKWQVRHIEVIRDANGNRVTDVVGLLEDVDGLELMSPTGPDTLMRTRDGDTNDRLYDERLE